MPPHTRWSSTAGLLLLAGIALPTQAAEPRAERYELRDTLVLGIAEHRLDPHTEVTGWRLNRSWYFGRESGEDALSLIWQGRRQQVSISTEGIRFVRRF